MSAVLTAGSSTWRKRLFLHTRAPPASTASARMSVARRPGCSSEARTARRLSADTSDLRREVRVRIVTLVGRAVVT
jgi:hypothetical protein